MCVAFLWRLWRLYMFVTSLIRAILAGLAIVVHVGAWSIILGSY